MSEFIVAKSVSFAYGPSPVIEQVSFSLAANDRVALMGDNGSGKTTMGKLFMGMLKPSHGQVLLEGRDVAQWPMSQRGEKIGYVFQNPEKQLFCSSAGQEIGFGLTYRGMDKQEVAKRVDEMLELFELNHCRENFPFNLSQGEKQRLVLAAVMALQPGFVILDEPTTGLDARRKQVLSEMLGRVADLGVGYVLISHDQEFCKKLCRRLLVMEGGRCDEQSF